MREASCSSVDEVPFVNVEATSPSVQCDGLDDSVIFLTASTAIQTDDWSVERSKKKNLKSNANKQNQHDHGSYARAASKVPSAAPCSGIQLNAKSSSVTAANKNKKNLEARRQSPKKTSEPNEMKWIHVSNVSPETTVASLSEFMSKTFKIMNSKCHSLLKRSQSLDDLRSVSFKVGVDKDSFDHILKSKKWPSEVKVREFVDRRSNFQRNHKLPVLR